MNHSRLRLSLLAPLLAVLALLLGLAGSASAAFNHAATDPHYGNFLLQTSEAPARITLAIADPDREIGVWLYDSTLGVPVYVRQNPWTYFDPLGLATTFQDEDTHSSSTEIPEPVYQPAPENTSTVDVSGSSARDLNELAAASAAAEANPVQIKTDWSGDLSAELWAATASTAELDREADSGRHSDNLTQLFRQHSQAASDNAHDMSIFSGTANGIEMMIPWGVPFKVLRGAKYAGGVFNAANSGSRIASEVGLNAGEITRIQNAANRIGKPINLVGSRASGTANAASDWDYVIEGMTNANKNAIKNSLPGAPIRADQVPRNIDFFTDSLRTDLPHIQFTPRQP